MFTTIASLPPTALNVLPSIHSHVYSIWCLTYSQSLSCCRSWWCVCHLERHQRDRHRHRWGARDCWASTCQYCISERFILLIHSRHLLVEDSRGQGQGRHIHYCSPHEGGRFWRKLVSEGQQCCTARSHHHFKRDPRVAYWPHQEWRSPCNHACIIFECLWSLSHRHSLAFDQLQRLSAPRGMLELTIQTKWAITLSISALTDSSDASRLSSKPCPLKGRWSHPTGNSKRIIITTTTTLAIRQVWRSWTLPLLPDFMWS